MDPARDYLIVDGHSIVFAWPELRALHARRPAAARDALVKALTGYQDGSGVRVVLVFDGQGPKASEEAGAIQVFYSPSGKTADDLVERLVAKYGATHRLTVATSDRLEQQTAITFGAVSCVSAEGLRSLLDRAGRELGRRLKTHRRQAGAGGCAFPGGR